MKSWMLFIAITFCLNSWAQDLKEYKEKFQIVRNQQQQAVLVRLKMIPSRFKLAPFIAQLRADLKSEQQKLALYGNNREEIEQFMGQLEAHALHSLTPQQVQFFRQAHWQLSEINLEQLLSEIEKSGLLKEFEDRLKKSLQYLDPTIMAHLENPKYFYTKNLTYQVVSWGLKEAQKRFSTNPLINLASLIIVKSHQMLEEQRIYHQNVLLHYMTTVPEDKLELTKEEVNKIVSSIYEAKIPPLSFFESKKAAQDWNSYGFNLFYQQLRLGRVKAKQIMTTQSQERTNVRMMPINFAFAEMSASQGQRHIYHLLINQHMFTSKPAMAFDYQNPNKMKRERALYMLIQLGTGQLPFIPGFIRSIADSFLDSLYKPQQLMEGALVAYFDIQGKGPIAKKIKEQNRNPYIK